MREKLDRMKAALEEGLARKGDTVLVDEVEEAVSKAATGKSRDEVFELIAKSARVEEPDLSSAEAIETFLRRHPAVMATYYNAPHVYRKHATAQPAAGTKAAVFAEIRAAAIKMHPKETPEKAVELYIRDFPAQYARYQDAPTG